MDKAKSKCRDIKFRSEKNQTVMCVHSQAAREYARILEEDASVVSYETCKELDQDRYQYVDPLDIRKDYFNTAWATDFVIHYADGTTGIREIVTESMLEKRANIEKLEFSRRYWSAADVTSWKIVIMEKGA